MGQGNNGLSRGDANRNARLAGLRAVLPSDHAILGIDLAQSRQAAALTDHDSRVLARWRPRCSPWQLDDLLERALRAALSAGFSGVTVACEPTGHRWMIVQQLLEDPATPGSAGHSLIDLIALAFTREAERLAGQGLAKTYQRRSFTRPPYPGVPSATVHLKVHAGRPDRLATSANRLTPDIPLNQLVATAHRRLSALVYPDARLGARVRALDPVFRGITSLPGRPATLGLVPVRYRDIERLARLILDDRSTLPTDTGVVGVSVMFDMTRIWENYVGGWLRLRSPGITVAAQQPIPLTDTGPKRTGLADFVLYLDGKPIAVYDAKYRPWRSPPSTDEIYQLFTYAQRLGVTTAALVYPAAESHRTTTTVGPVTIESWAVPIEAPDQQ